MQTLSKKSFIMASLGVMIEYYDCVLFPTFLAILAPIFFLSGSTYQALVKSYFILLFAMLMRPLGGLLFGYLGDLLGRRKALLCSLYGIAVATLAVGLTPSYQTIGIWAIIIIFTAKLVQSFSFGGEYNGAGIYVVEHAQDKNEASVGGYLTAMTLVGGLVASLFGVLLTMHFMPAWSWRLAFIFGGIVGLIGAFCRKNMLEVPNFKPGYLKKDNFLSLIKTYPREMFAGLCIGGFYTVPFTTALVFINPVLVAEGYLSTSQMMWTQVVMNSVAILALVSAGKVADKKTPAKIMRFAALFLILFSYPLLWLVDLHAFYLILLTQVAFIVINELLLGPANAYLKNQFAMQYRYRGSSLSFGLGMSLFGGLTPIIENFLYRWTHHFSTISLWLIFIGVITFVSLYFVARKKKKSVGSDLSFSSAS